MNIELEIYENGIIETMTDTKDMNLVLDNIKKRISDYDAVDNFKITLSYEVEE